MSRTSKPNSKVLSIPPSTFPKTKLESPGPMNIIELIAFAILCVTYLVAMYIMIRGL